MSIKIKKNRSSRNRFRSPLSLWFCGTNGGNVELWPWGFN